MQRPRDDPSHSVAAEVEETARHRQQFHHTQNHAKWTAATNNRGTTSSVYAPPQVVLYTDAIHCILQFLKLGDFPFLIRLNHQWHDAVRSFKVPFGSQLDVKPPFMRLGFSVVRPNAFCLDKMTLQEIQKHPTSPLLRHVTTMRLSGIPDPSVVSQLFPSLQILDIDNEHCDCQVVDMIKSNKNLTSVSVFFSGEYATGASALADAIKQHDRLTSVSILGTATSGDDFSYIADAVFSEKVTGVLLIGDGCDLDVDAALHMAAAIKANKRLSEVTLQYLGIEQADSVAAVADAIKQHESLTYLDLASNYFSDDGTSSIAAALQTNRCLTKLNLSGSVITDVGAAALAELFKQNKTLTKIDLGNNEIGDSGARSLADAIKQNTSLTYLSLSDNQIGAAGASSIAESINQNKSICADLRGNPISNAHISSIAASVDAAVVSTDLCHPYFHNLSDSSIRLFLPPFIDEAHV